MITAADSALLEARQSSSSAFSMAGFLGLYFGLRVCLTFLFFQSDPQTGAILSFALNLLLLVPVAFYAATPSSVTLRVALRPLPVRLVLVFLMLSLLSLTWSETSSRAIAFGYWTAMAADVALVLLILRTDASADAYESLLKGFVAGWPSLPSSHGSLPPTPTSGSATTTS